MKISKNTYKTVHFTPDLSCIEVYLTDAIQTDKAYLEQTKDWLNAIEKHKAEFFLVDMTQFSYILTNETVGKEAALVAKRTMKSGVKKGAYVIGDINSPLLSGDENYKRGYFEYFSDIEKAYEWLVLE